MPEFCLIAVVAISVLSPLNMLGAEPQKPVHGEFAFESVAVGGEKRLYRLVVPKSVDLAKPAPLVVAFHGIALDSKELMPRYTKLNETATKHQFLLVYPEAAGKSWGLSPEKAKDDLEFFDALLTTVKARYKIDTNRIYVVGMSNGGYFAHLIGKRRSTVVAAVASHSGPSGLTSLAGVNAERKFPVMIIHGERDHIFPIEQARQDRDKYKKEGHRVEYLEIPKMGHMWAVKADVNEKIWNFFEKQSLDR